MESFNEETLNDAPSADAGDAPGAAEEEARLVQRACAGDHRAFESLMRRYASMVMGYAAGRFDARDADDLLQETFLTAYRQIENLRDARRFGPWLMRIARSRCIDLQRRRKARPVHEGIEDESAALLVPADASRGPASLAAAMEIEAAVTSAIGALSEHYRIVVYLRIMSDMSPKEIAQRLDLGESTVRMRLMRGLKLVRETLAGLGFER